jgi:uncharacterized NAD(P)/FAD-binding protein YdhS
MDPVDIAFIGSGIATTLSMIEVLSGIQNNPNPPVEPTTIAVIERHPQFWRGIPYGSRSSVNALTITSVLDFVNETERPAFFQWLKTTRPEWTTHYREQGGEIANRWLEKNLPLLDQEAWDTVYIPRFLFGNYIAQKLTRLQHAVEEKRLAQVRLIQAEALDLKPDQDGFFQITFELPANKTDKLLARKCVLSTGSVPVDSMCQPSNSQTLYINDLYAPSASANIQSVETILQKTDNPDDRNILVIGSNASSIEWLYLLEGMPAMRRLVNKTVVISTSGLLPYRISTESLAEHPIPHLKALMASGDYDIKTLTDAAAMDINLAVRDGANMDYVATIIGNTLKLLESLGEEAKKAFYAIHAIRLRDSFRRSGPEYRGAAQLLLDEQELTMLKGRFLKASTAGETAQFTYTDPDGQLQTYPMKFKVIINCTGSANLDRTSSRLLHGLVHNGICQVNLSGKGFLVNERFEAAPNLYVIGPLLGGNVNRLIHFWQLENASRLTYLAPYLAQELLKS